MSFIKANALTNIDYELLHQSGCIEVQLGIESAVPLILKNMNKKATPSLYGKVIESLIKVGINCSCYLIFGFPGETTESAAQTREFIRKMDLLDYEGIITFSMFPFILTPLSPIYDSGMRKQYGLLGYMHNWKHKTMDSKQAMEEVMRTFFESNSGLIYRGDSQDLLASLNPKLRKLFIKSRHDFSKAFHQGLLNENDLRNGFYKIFYRN
jgi:p-methyltransferase